MSVMPILNGQIPTRGCWCGLIAAIALAAACSRSQERATPTPLDDVTAAESARANLAADDRKAERDRMVDEQLAGRDITEARLLAAMRQVPRHELIPEAVRSHAYDDTPLPIGFDQTISQPYIVAAMTQLAKVEPGMRVLEVGTGSGYQAAVLAAMGAKVYSIEIVEPLGERARRDLARLGYSVELRIGDGYQGWPEAAPFEAILVTAAPAQVPEPLKQQLAVGGRLIIPVGVGTQDLLVITRTNSGFEQENVLPVRFVPMTGETAR